MVLDAFTRGGAQVDSFYGRDTLHLTDVVSWQTGGHVVKAGFSLPTLGRRVLDDRSNFDGTFYFSSLEAFELGRPFTFSQNSGDSRLRFWYKVASGFVQDNIRISPNLSIGAGIRYEWQNFTGNQNNLSPRLSFAYGLGKSRKTVIRGGAGFFHRRTGPGPIRDVLRFDGERLQRIDITDPGYPDPFAGAGAVEKAPTGVVTFDPTFRAPYHIHRSLAVERQLTKSSTLTATYINVRGVSAFRSRDLNAPPPPLYLARPVSATGVWRQFESSGNLKSHQLKLGLTGNLTRFLNGGFYYTLGSRKDDTAGIRAFPANNFDLSGEWGRANSDARNRYYFYGSIGAGKLFDLGVIMAAHTGRPYTITTGTDDNLDSRATDRPPHVTRNTEQGPGYVTLDLRWSKAFPFARTKNGKGASLTMSVDAFNVLNRVNRYSLVGNLVSPFFGEAVSAAPARRMQVTARVRF